MRGWILGTGAVVVVSAVVLGTEIRHPGGSRTGSSPAVVRSAAPPSAEEETATSRPPGDPRCVVQLVLGDPEGDAWVDPRLASHRAVLRDPSLARYRRFEQLEVFRGALPLEVTTTLGRRVALRRGPEPFVRNERLSLSLEIHGESRPLLSTTYRIDDGAPLVVAGERRGEGRSVYLVTCHA